MSILDYISPVSLAVKAVVGSFGAVAKPLFGFFDTRANDELAGFEVGAKVDSGNYRAWLQATVQLAQTKAAMNAWWGARLIFLSLGALVTYHYGWVVVDSCPQWSHVPGSWHVAALPHPLDEWEGTIVLSFFAATPLAPVASAAVAWIHRR